jgi:hypothetical protein
LSRRKVRGVDGLRGVKPKVEAAVIASHVESMIFLHLLLSRWVRYEGVDEVLQEGVKW